MGEGGAMRSESAVRDLLRGLPVLQHGSPTFSAEQAAESPVELFSTWLRTAVDAHVVEPHAMVLSTVDADGAPDARALILKDLREEAWWFSTDTSTAKAAQLSARPAASMTFYWPTLGRQVRLRGAVRTGTQAENRLDFLERGVSARAVVAAARTTTATTTRNEFADAVAAALEILQDQASYGSDAWRTYGLVPTRVEFWQADPDRLHQRLVYTRTGTQWARRTLAH